MMEACVSGDQTTARPWPQLRRSVWERVIYPHDQRCQSGTALGPSSRDKSTAKVRPKLRRAFIAVLIDNNKGKIWLHAASLRTTRTQSDLPKVTCSEYGFLQSRIRCSQPYAKALLQENSIQLRETSHRVVSRNQGIRRPNAPSSTTRSKFLASFELVARSCRSGHCFEA